MIGAVKNPRSWGRGRSPRRDERFMPVALPQGIKKPAERRERTGTTKTKRP